MILSDIHMHTDFSSDSKSPMESMIQGAIEKGLKTICFTEHLDYEYPADNSQDLFLVDIDAYQKKLYTLKKSIRTTLIFYLGLNLAFFHIYRNVMKRLHLLMILILSSVHPIWFRHLGISMIPDMATPMMTASGKVDP